MFNVEQGTHFYLKLNGNPGPGLPELYKDGQKLYSSPFGTIRLTPNSVGIETATPGHAGTYKIKSSNGAELTFKVVVTGKTITNAVFPQKFTCSC